MNTINKCLKEWNATIEALGQGKQSILIRNYKTNITEFLLFPTFSYASNDGYIENFQSKHQKFVEENSLPEKKDDKVLIKYFATLKKIIEKPISRIPSDKNYIWTRKHVKNYMTGKTAFVWILRVYKLEEPYWAEPSRAIKHVKLNEKVPLEGMKPILSDSDFKEIENLI